MADFYFSYLKTMGHEGYYANDPDDVGKETWKGVSRAYHPSWEGWKIVDNDKSLPNFPARLKNNPELEVLVQDFYKAMFWDTTLGDRMPNQDIADEMFDTGVNQGVSRAVSFLQESLNILNKNQIIYKDLVVDGKFGNNTLSTLNTFLRADKPSLLLKVMNVLQGMHYIEYIRKSPTQEKFARSWFSRVEITKV